MQNGERVAAALNGLADVTQLDHRVVVVRRLREFRFERTPDEIGDDRGASRVRMDPIGLVQRGVAGHAVEQERQQADFVLLGQRRSRPPRNRVV